MPTFAAVERYGVAYVPEGAAPEPERLVLSNRTYGSYAAADRQRAAIANHDAAEGYAFVVKVAVVGDNEVGPPGAN